MAFINATCHKTVGTPRWQTCNLCNLCATRATRATYDNNMALSSLVRGQFCHRASYMIAIAIRRALQTADPQRPALSWYANYAAGVQIRGGEQRRAAEDHWSRWGIIPAKRRLVASFKLALVKVCQGHGQCQCQGQLKILIQLYLQPQVQREREREIIDRLRSLCIFVFVFKNLQLFRWPFATF